MDSAAISHVDFALKYFIKMGQLLSVDKSPQLHLETAVVNVRQRRTYMPLVVFKGV
jgi:hypothetical protein